MTKTEPHKFSIAPMMEWTDRHCRFFHRTITERALLYTEMVTADAIIHGDTERLLGFSEAEHPVALQLGGSDPEKLQQATQIANEFGYDEINLNIGCPSDRVQNGSFGACLMREPVLVRECMTAIGEVSEKPPTVKCRIGVDEMDDDEGLQNFVEVVKGSGVNTFIVHARKAWLQGLSPKQNREVPPLNYERVYKLKAEHPDLTIIINGGIETLEQASEHLAHTDGVMMGRAAYHTPYILERVDKRMFFEYTDKKSRFDIAEAMIPYIERELAKGTRLHQITRHMLGLFHGEPNARMYRRILSTQANKEGAGLEVYNAALDCMRHSQDQELAS
jgi:tRNA-dihydrouridine synthase A